jgi:hypothetical protein
MCHVFKVGYSVISEFLQICWFRDAEMPVTDM